MDDTEPSRLLRKSSGMSSSRARSHSGLANVKGKVIMSYQSSGSPTLISILAMTASA